MSIENIANKQFEKFRKGLESADFTKDFPVENARQNLVQKLRVQNRPGGDKSADIYDTLCSDYLRNIDF